MPDDLNKYTSTTANWRQSLRQNVYRSYVVIGLFFLIYTGIGLLVDLYLNAATYPNATINELFHALIQFQLFPTVTLIMFGVALVSLLISYALHDRLMLLGTGYHEVTTTHSRDVKERQLYNVVEEMKIASGLRYMPKVYIIDADYMNAFASGYSERSAMVAITRGLMEKLNRDELQAVMAHELSHIRHLDIKLTMTASLLANLSIMILDIFFYNAMFAHRNQEGNGKSRNAIAGIIILIRYLLPIISILLLLYLSRTRELMADAGSVELMRTNEPLATALIKIHQDHVTNKDQYTLAYQRTAHENVRREAYIFDPMQAGIMSLRSMSDLFSSHPSLEKRLNALGYQLKKND